MSRFTEGLAETFSPPRQALPPTPPQENTSTENSAEVPQAVAPKPPRHYNRTAHQERPHTARPPTTSGAASVENQDRSPAQSGDDKRDSPLNLADREALFQDFMKWQMERSMFGRP
ncbi:MAG: hypothetical protein J2P53_12695 [Bradyrhizobiaceae bacterium]|nr:hypothetical protein [Bradyrhizobiaceae bacterium]